MNFFTTVNNYYFGDNGSDPGARHKCGERCQSTLWKAIAAALVVVIVIIVLGFIVSQYVGGAGFVEFLVDAALTAVGVLLPLVL